MNDKYENTSTMSQKIGFFFLFSVVLSLIVFLAGFRNAAITSTTYVAFAIPGILLCRKVGLSSWRMIVYGVPVGLGLTSFIVIVVVSMVGWQINYIVLSWIIFTCFILLTPFTIQKINNGNANSTDKEIAINDIMSVPPSILMLIALFTLLVYIPLSKVGALTEHGYAFTGLFSHDFILRALDAVALANSIPADNYFFNGEITQNYYLLWYILPATVYNLLGHIGNIREIVAVICVLNVPFFLLIFYFTLKDFLGARLSRQKAPLVFFLVIYCASYHWLFVAAKTAAHFLHIRSADIIFSKMHAVSQTWYRDLIFEPHCILALMLFFCLFAVSRQPPSLKRGVALGVLLSLIALSDTVIFLIVGVWYFFGALIYLVRSRKFDGIYDVLAVSTTGFSVVVLMFVLGVFGITEYSNKLVVKPYMFVIATLPFFLILHYGITSVTWLSVFRAKALDRKWQLLFLALVSIFFMMFITESLEGNVVLRKAIKVGRIPFSLLAGYFFCGLKKKYIYQISLFLFVLALPTFLTDIYALTNVNDRNHTSYISKNQMEAVQWIKNNTPNNAIVQSAIDYPGYYDFSLTACFGERKASLGHWKMAFQRYPNLSRIKERDEKIDKLFMTDDLTIRESLLQELDIDYLFIGKNENELYPGVGERFKNDPTCKFKTVYRKNKLSIYMVDLGISFARENQ